MLAINKEEFNNFGCVNCGCNSCYSEGNNQILVCSECGTKFIVVSNEKIYSNIKIVDSNNSYKGLIVKDIYSFLDDQVCFKILMLNSTNDAYFKADYLRTRADKYKEFYNKYSTKGAAVKESDNTICPIVTIHPRYGTPCHDLVVKDVRPENEIGEFCTPKSLEDMCLICSIKTEEAAKRIINMFNDTLDEYNFIINYMYDRPLNTEILISSQTKKLKKLRDLIIKNNNIITQDIVDNIDSKQKRIIR